MADVNANIGISIDSSSALAELKSLQRQISQFHTSIAKSSTAAATAQASLQKNFLNSVNAIGAFSAQMVNVKTSSQAFTDSLEKNKFSMREYFRYATASTKTFGKVFKTEYDTIGRVAEERVKKLQTQYIKMGQSTNGIVQAMAITPKNLDMTSFSTQTAIAAQKQQLFNQLLKQGSTNLLNFGKNTQWAGRQLMVGFTLPLAALGQTSAKAFMDMEAQALKFKKVYGDLFTPQEETQTALANIQELAKSFTQYGIAASATVGLASDAAAAGFKGLDLTAQTTQATRLSVLGQIDQQKALETTIALQNAFNISAQELAGSVDFLNAVENQTVVSLDDITTAIPKVAPVIQQLGGDVKDLAFFLTAMKEGGINASEGANALKSGLGSLINPTKRASDMLAAFGINIKDIVTRNRGDLKKTIVEFASALNQLDPLNRAQAIEQMFGKFQFARLSTLFQNVTKDGSQASRVLDLAGQSISDLAQLSDKELGMTASSPMMKFKKAVEDLKITLIPVGKAFLEAATPIVKFVGDILDKFNNLGDGTKKAIALIVGVVGGLGPILLMTFGLIANGVANILKLFATLRGGFSRLTGESKILGEQTQYMTMEQLDAAAAAHSLDQIHAKLTQQFTAEASAVIRLRDAYASAVAAGTKFAAINPGMMIPGKRKGFAEGGIIHGAGTGTSDSIPIMASDGEAIIPADTVKKYPTLVAGLVSGNIPKFANGTVNVSGRSIGMNFQSVGSAAQIQNIIDKIMSGGTKLENAEEVVAETLARLSEDSKISLKSFMKELDIVTASMEKVQLPESIVGERKYSAKKAGVKASISEQMSSSRGLLGEEEVRRANVAAQAVYEEYKKLGVTGSKLDQSLQIDRAHVIETTNAFKRYEEAWQTNAYIVQTHAENELSQSLTYANNQQAYIDTLAKIDATEQQKASIADKVTKNLALTEDELQIQAKVLQEMLGDANIMKKTSASFGVTARGTIAAANARAAMGPASAGVGSRTIQETQAAQRALTSAAFRGEMSFIRKLEQNATNAIDRLIISMQRKAQTASPSKRTQKLGKDIIDGITVGIRSGEAQLEAETNKVADIALMSKTSLYGAGPVDPIQKSIRRQQQKLSMSDTGAMAIGSQTSAAADEQRKKIQQSTAKLESFNGKLMGGMYALSALSGMASMAGGSLGQFSNVLFQISAGLTAVSSVLQLFTGEKIISLLSKFKVGFGLASAALVAGVIAIKLVNSAREKERLAIEGVGKAANITADQIKKLGDIYGFTPQKSPLELAKPTSPAVNPQQRTQIEQTKDLFKKDKDFKANIQSLKTASNEQANIILKSVAIKLAGAGASKEAIQNIITALQEEAGRTDVKFDLKSVDFSTEEGRAGVKKSVDQLLGTFKTEFNKGYSKTYVRNPYTGQIFEIENASKSLKTTLSTVSNALAATFTGLSGQLANGTINADAFGKAFDGISASIQKMPEPNAMYLMSNLLKTLPSELAQSAANIKNVSDQLMILKAATLGVAVTAAMMDTLASNSTDGGNARAKSRIRAKIKQQISERMKIAEEVAKEFKNFQDVPTSGTPDKTPYQLGLEQLKQQRKEIANSATAYKKLVANGIDGAKAFELSKDSVIAAALASKMTKEQWNTILTLIKQTNKELATQAVGDYLKKLKGENELQKQFNTIVPLLDKMGMSADDIQNVMNDPNLMQGFIDGLKEGKTGAQQIQWIIDRLAEKKTIDLEFKLSTTGGQQQLFSEGYSAAMGYFDAQGALIEQQRTGSAEYQKINKDIEDQTAAVKKAQDAIDGYQSKIDSAQYDLQYNTKYGQGVIDNLNGQIDAINRSIDIDFDRPLQALSNESDILSNNLSLIDQQEQAINKVYDAQIAALTQVSELNSEITNQQKQQLDLAGAITSGDISAAAKVAQDMRASAAQAAQDRAQKSVEAARQGALAGVTAGGMTRDQIEQRQFQISQEQFRLTEARKVKEAEILAIQDKLYAIDQLRAPIQKNISDYEYQIANIKATQLDPAQKLLDAANKTKETYDAQTKSLIDGVLDALGKTKADWIKQQTEIEAAKTKTDEYTSKLTTAQGVAAGVLAKILALNTTVVTTHIINTIYTSSGNNTAKPKMYGGWIKKMAAGGIVGGIGNTDSVLTALTPGEFVVNKASAKAFGPMLQSINESKYPNMLGSTGSVNSSSFASTTLNNSSNMYNYNLGITVNGSNLGAQELAGAVITEIKKIDAQRIKGIR